MYKILCLSHGEYLYIAKHSIYEQDGIIAGYNTQRACCFPGMDFNSIGPSFIEAHFKTYDLAYFYLVELLERIRTRSDYHIIFEHFEIVEI